MHMHMCMLSDMCMDTGMDTDMGMVDMSAGTHRCVAAHHSDAARLVYEWLHPLALLPQVGLVWEEDPRDPRLHRGPARGRHGRLRILPEGKPRSQGPRDDTSAMLIALTSVGQLGSSANTSRTRSRSPGASVTKFSACSHFSDHSPVINRHTIRREMTGDDAESSGAMPSKSSRSRAEESTNPRMASSLSAAHTSISSRVDVASTTRCKSFSPKRR